LGRSCSGQVADNNESSRDPDPNLQACSCGGSFELRDSLNEGKPGANGALSIMLMRFGVAKIGEGAIVHVFRDEATIALDQLRAAAVMGSNDAS
jgi:hypothetical protein